MTCEDLIRLAKRLTGGPVPTLEKKVYGYHGNIEALVRALPPAITIQTRISAACQKEKVPLQEEQCSFYLQEQLTRYLQSLQEGHATSMIVLQEAALLARYRIPLSFLYGLTGDAHAIILHLDEAVHRKEWKFPPYLHYDPEAPVSYFTQVLGNQFIQDELAEGERL